MKLFAHLIFPALILTPQYATGAGTDSSEARIGAPVAGYVFDPAVRSIRPVLGTAGASVAGDPLDISLATGGQSVALAAVSPKQDFVVIVGAEDLLVRVLGLQDGAINSRLLAPAATGPREIVFSPGGGTAGLYQPDPARLQIFTHLPEKPVLAHEISLAGLPGDLHAAAISDDGELALLLTGNRSDPSTELSSTWLSLAGADPVRLEAPFSTTGTSAMSFQGGSHNVAMAARDGQVLILRDVETNPGFQVLSSPDDRTSEPVAVHFSADGTRVYVATRQGTVADFGIQTGSASFISCRCTPSVLVPFHSSTLFRLNEFSDGPLMLLDTDNPELRIWFVPAVVPAVVPAAGPERGAR